LDQLDKWIASTGPEAYLVLCLAAMIEYVVPPFPGDTIIILGGIYAARGQKPWWLVFAVMTLGSVFGSAVDYWVGLKIGDRITQLPEEKLFFGLSRSRLLDLRRRMRKNGSSLIAINRFLPAVRGVLFIAAGTARMSFRRVMVLGAASAVAWNLLLMWLGTAVGGNAERLEVLIRNYQLAVYAVLVILALALAIRYLQRRRHRRSAHGSIG
jgi:membrane protein DedA with SNARE-associated domain